MLLAQRRNELGMRPRGLERAEPGKQPASRAVARAVGLGDLVLDHPAIGPARLFRQGLGVHGEWIAANLPGVTHHRIANAWHFAFADTPGIALTSEDGDLRADPPGFDRAAFLQRLARELPAFFDQALR